MGATWQEGRLDLGTLVHRGEFEGVLWGLPGRKADWTLGLWYIGVSLRVSCGGYLAGRLTGPWDSGTSG